MALTILGITFFGLSVGEVMRSILPFYAPSGSSPAASGILLDPRRA